MVHNGGMPHPIQNPILNENEHFNFQQTNKYGDLIVYFHVKYPELDQTRIDLLKKIIPFEEEVIPTKLVELQSISLTTEQNKKLFKSLYETKINPIKTQQEDLPSHNNNTQCPIQ